MFWALGTLFGKLIREYDQRLGLATEIAPEYCVAFVEDEILLPDEEDPALVIVILDTEDLHPSHNIVSQPLNNPLITHKKCVFTSPADSRLQLQPWGN